MSVNSLSSALFIQPVLGTEIPAEEKEMLNKMSAAPTRLLTDLGLTEVTGHQQAAANSEQTESMARRLRRQRRFASGNWRAASGWTVSLW